MGSPVYSSLNFGAQDVAVMERGDFELDASHLGARQLQNVARRLESIEASEREVE